MAEILFDILHTEAIFLQEFRVKNKFDKQMFNEELTTYFRLSDIKEFIVNAQESLSLLNQTGVSCYSLNLAPRILKSAELKSKVSAAVYKNFTSLFDGKSTIRDVAYKINQDTIKLSFVLLPYIRKGLIELVEVNDLFIKPEQEQKQDSSLELVLRNPLICCIDDSPLNYHLMENVIKKLGYDFLGIKNSVQALSLLLKSPPNLIFLDIIMPEMDGYTLCRQIKQIALFKAIPVIMLTGEEKLTAQIKARSCGADDFIRKPITRDKILPVVERFLKARKESEHESQSSSSLRSR